MPLRESPAPFLKMVGAHQPAVFDTVNHPQPASRAIAFARRNLLGMAEADLWATLNAASEAMRSSGIDFARFGQKRTNAELLRLHETTLAIMRDLQRRGMGHLQMTISADVKPAGAFPSPRLTDLTPIYASALAVGVTHRGRALRATIVGAPYVMVAAQLLLEDERGDFVKLSVYNRVRSQAEADALFVVGRRLLVLEPYFKCMADGTQGIRADNPNEVILMPAEAGGGRPAAAPSAAASGEARKAEGNGQVGAAESDEAVASDTHGLDEVDSQASARALVLCCLILAACLLKLREPMRALAAAVATLALLAWGMGW